MHPAIGQMRPCGKKCAKAAAGWSSPPVVIWGLNSQLKPFATHVPCVAEGRGQTRCGIGVIVHENKEQKKKREVSTPMATAWERAQGEHR